MTGGPAAAPPAYDVAPSASVGVVLDRIDRLAADLALRKTARPDLWPTVLKKLKVQWTTESNAIEGSSLSFGDTLFFLEHGLTVEGKPFKDFLDARNHAQAIELLFDAIANRRPLGESLIKEVNALLLSGVTSTAAVDQFGRQVDKPANPGAYKTLPNHVLLPDGRIHRYVDPLHVPAEMEQLCRWIGESQGKRHPVVVAAIAHYNFVRIHPFDDGNGRGARLLTNLVLMRAEFPPAVIANERRRAYLDALRRADAGELAPFLSFVGEAAETTLQALARDLSQ
ncbi:MAG: Fic family protein [Hyphomicrobiaceae bacterium]